MKRSGKVWTAEEVEYLKANYNSKPLAEMAEKLDRTEGAVKDKAHTFGLVMRSRKRFTEYEKNYIRSNYGIIPTEEIAETLGRKEKAVNNMAYKLGIKPTAIDLTRCITLAEANEFTGANVETWSEYGLHILDVDNVLMVNEQELASVMENYPDLYNGMKCNEVFFAIYPFFRVKRKADMDKICNDRWKDFYPKKTKGA